MLGAILASSSDVRFYDASPVLLFLKSPHGDDKIKFIEHQERHHSILIQPKIINKRQPARTPLPQHD